MNAIIRWASWRLWARGPWSSCPPQQTGFYLMRTRRGLRWSTPERVECVTLGGPNGRVCQMDLLTKPKADRRWMPWR